MSKSTASPSPKTKAVAHWLPLLVGGFLGLALLKFGNAIIMEKYITWPRDGFEWLIRPWPTTVGHVLLIMMALAGGCVARWRRPCPRWLAMLPLAWLAWQLIAATTTVDPVLTGLTLKHFAACVLCFYLGYFALDNMPVSGGFGRLILLAMIAVIVNGAYQRLIGQAETRAYIQSNEPTHWRNLPPEETAEMEREGLLLRTPDGWTANPSLLKKAESDRISSTLFYPNALAGALLLMLPPCLVMVATTRWLTPAARGFATGLLGLGGLICLYWSGSKAGWLLALGLGGLGLLRSPLNRTIKMAVVVGLLVLGLAGFAARYAGFFQRGATSVVARFDYWQAALQTAVAHPLRGTGPGTFFRSYQRLKKPESEVARLAHNDYLQQASDSGWPGFVLYSASVWGILMVAGRRIWPAGSGLQFATWLGVVGWAGQGFVEFGLYIPALAWPAFVWLGWLLATRPENTSTKPSVNPKLDSYS